jgi:dTDP-4-dehydrorhamnose 3,5-epimerase
MVATTESPLIIGVKLVSLRSFVDERGSFAETFRNAWFPERSWETVQMNCSRSRAGVLRGLHYHRRQVDYWHVIHGAMRVGLVDLRRGSPTHRAAQALDIGDENPLGLLIPVGVAHGYLALSDLILTYLVDNYYDANDEYGVAWNDPTLGLDWGLGKLTPITSGRDRCNPTLAEIPPAQLPAWTS